LGGWAAAQLEACVRCGICAGACPFYDVTGDPHYTPVWKLEALRRVYAQQHTLLGRLMLAIGLHHPLSAADLQPYQEVNFGGCSTCNRCSVACPMGVNVGLLLHQARDILAEAGTLPGNLLTMAATVAREGNVFGYPAYERAGWVEYMADAPADLYQRETSRVVYFVGCVSSFSPRAQRTAEAFARILQAAGVEFSILGEGEVCCGFPLRAAGLLSWAEALIEANLQAVRAHGADTVVFNCPACRLMWIEEYAARLPGVRLLHAVEYLPELLAAGKLTLGETPITATYHDPCDLARTGGVYDPPRQVLGSLPGLRLIEAVERRAEGLCCGGGGDVEMVAPAMVHQVGARAAARLSSGGAQVLVTACPQCTRVLEQGLKEIKAEMQTQDIVELVARAAGLAG
jgi:heterodisulfide reductase subunit D